MNNFLELLYLISFTGILAVAYSYLLSGQILSSSPGNSRMQEIAQAIQTAIEEADASSIKDMGAVMNVLRPKIQGRADMAAVSGKVKSALSN